MKILRLLTFTGVFTAITSLVSAQCTGSSSINTSASTTTSASVSWTAGGGSSWNIQYGPTGFTLGSGTITSASSTSTTISGLSPNVVYDVYIQDDCGGSSSSWAGPIQMSGTLYPCDEYDNYQVDDIDAQSILFNGWNGNGGDAPVVTEQAYSGNKSLKVYTTGGSGFTDIVATPGTYNSGIHIVEFAYYMPQDYGGYYNLLHNYTGPTNVWAIEVYIDSSGTAMVEEGTNGTNDIGEYELDVAQWNVIEHIINFDDDTAFIKVNGNFTDVGWQWSLGSTNYGDQWNAVDFYTAAPTGQTCLYYTDDFCVSDAPVDDIGITAFIESPPYCGDSNYQVTAVIENYAYNSQSGFDVDVNVTGAVTYSGTYTYNGTLHPGVKDTVVVAVINNAAGGTMNFSIATDLSGDNNTSNDGVTATGLTFVSSPSVNLGPDVDYCTNQTLGFTLNAGNSGSSYLWQDGSTGQTMYVDTAGAYYVAVTNSNNCTVIDSVIVTLYEAPQVDLGPDTSFCEGSSIGLYLNAGIPIHDYLWNTGDSTNSLFVTTAGSFVVTVTADNGCVEIDSVVVEELAAPVIPIEDTAICGGDTFYLNAGNFGGTFNWNTGATSQVIQVFQTGTYSVTVTGQNGCVEDASADITVNIVPFVDLGENVVIFQGQSTILNAGNTGASYLWSTGETTMTITVSTTGTYSVTVTNGFDCSASDDVKVTVKVGVEDLEEAGVSVYPIPTQNILNIEFSNQDMKGAVFELYDLQGKLLDVPSTKQASGVTFNLESVDQGMYVLKISDQDGAVKHFVRVLKIE